MIKRNVTTFTGAAAESFAHDAARAAHKDEYPFIETIRAVAALLVLLGHTRNWFFEITTLGAADKAFLPFYFVTALARESVIVFFVVSGFLVGGRALVDMQAGRFSPRQYFTSRFARIYIAYIPALIVTFGLLEVLYRASPATIEAMGDEFNISHVDNLGGASSALCHLANIQGLFCRYSPSNPALWSLGYEWVLYLAAPAIFAIAAVPGGIRARVAMLLCAGCGFFALVLNPAEAIVLCSIWFLSALSYRHSTLHDTPKAVAYTALLLFAALVLLARLKAVSLYITNPGIGLCLLVAMSSKSVLNIRIAPGWSRLFASFSFSLYMTHLPVAFTTIFVMRQLGFALRPAPMSLAPLAAFGTLVCVCVSFAFLFSRLTEQHTAQFRRWLTQAPNHGRKQAHGQRRDFGHGQASRHGQDRAHGELM